MMDNPENCICFSLRSFKLVGSARAAMADRSLIVTFGEWNRSYDVAALWTRLADHEAEFLDTRQLFDKKKWDEQANMITGKSKGKGKGKGKFRPPHYHPDGLETDAELRAQALGGFFDAVHWRPAQIKY